MQLIYLQVFRIALVAMFIMVASPSFAGEMPTKITGKTTFSAGESDIVDKVVTIGGATVRIKLVGGVAYIAVQEGTLSLTYADGTPMTSIEKGTVLKVEGFLGLGSSLTATTSGLALGPALDLKLESNAKGKELSINQPGSTTPIKLAPGKAANVAAPFVTFTEGQKVSLKEGQVGKISSGGNSLIAIGTSTGLSVTTQNPTAIINGGGGDKITLSKGALLNITGGELNVANGGVNLTGSNATLVNGGGRIQVTHNNETKTFSAGQTITGTTRTGTPPGGNTPVTTVITGKTVDLKVNTYNPNEVFGGLETWTNLTLESSPSAQ